MEIQLQELIDQIKKDGVDAAESEAAAIVQAARDEAARIIAAAEAQAEQTTAAATAATARTVKSGEDAIRQAGRNLLLSFRDSVTRELDAIIGERVSAVYRSDALTALIIKVVEGYRQDTDDIAVLLNAADLAALQDNLLAALKERLLTGVTLKASDTFDGGFRVAVDGGAAYYDYSAAAVADMLSAYLNPHVTALLKEAAANE